MMYPKTYFSNEELTEYNDQFEGHEADYRRLVVQAGPDLMNALEKILNEDWPNQIRTERDMALYDMLLHHVPNAPDGFFEGLAELL